MLWSIMWPVDDMNCRESLSSYMQPEMVGCERIWLLVAISMKKCLEQKHWRQFCKVTHSNSIVWGTNTHKCCQRWKYRWVPIQYPCEQTTLKQKKNHCELEDLFEMTKSFYFSKFWNFYDFSFHSILNLKLKLNMCLD